MVEKNIDINDAKLLGLIEQVLLELKKEHEADSFEELEKHILTEAKKETSNMKLSKQVEFLALLHEILDAYEFAAEKHRNQKRDSGESYISHPLYVALNEITHQKNELKEFRPSPILAAILHDTVEDTDTSYSDINKSFGNRVTQLVGNVTNNPNWDQWKDQGQLTHVEKSALQFVNAYKDKDSLSIKYDDRFHNLETIRYKEPKSRVKKILDTITVGFIEHAERLKRFDFLIELYITIRRYLSSADIERYAEDPIAAKEIKEYALTTIQEILRRNKIYS